MELYLSGSFDNHNIKNLEEYEVLFLLQTFYEMRDWTEEKVNKIIRLPKYDFMLDSGAFTFMNSGKQVKWKKYVDEYCDFVNKYDVRLFIELDLYGIIGLEKTEKIRKYIEKKTGKLPIPVYHGTLPLSYFRQLCELYPYVAISATGTIESSKWTRDKKVLKQVVKIGHSYGVKIHGLGYTRLENLNTLEIPFDSVDSTACLSGGRYGTWYYLKHERMFEKSKANQGIHYKELNKNNISVWIKKQKMLYNQRQL